MTLDVWILTGAAIPATLYPIVYWVLAPWYRSDWGRAAWSIMLAIAALLDVALVAYWFHWTVPEWLARVIYVLIFCACWMKFGALINHQLIAYARRRKG